MCVGRPGEQRRGGGEQCLLAHLLEPLVTEAQPLLRCRGVSREHLYQRFVMRDRLLHSADVVEYRVRLTDEQASAVELSLHRAKNRERMQGHCDGDRATTDFLVDLRARLDRLHHRGRSPNRGGGTPGKYLEELPLLTGSPRVVSGAPPRAVCPGQMTLGPLDPGLQAPRPALTEVVSVLFEDPKCRGNDSRRLADRSTGFRMQPDKLLLDAGT